ncbi:MAG: hypothetical protein HOQ05_04770, partial [Corynebacteriales bacterium]|nr:hypothetical protein [Mycobacteriales bacterium]
MSSFADVPVLDQVDEKLTAEYATIAESPPTLERLAFHSSFTLDRRIWLDADEFHLIGLCHFAGLQKKIEESRQRLKQSNEELRHDKSESSQSQLAVALNDFRSLLREREQFYKNWQDTIEVDDSLPADPAFLRIGYEVGVALEHDENRELYADFLADIETDPQPYLRWTQFISGNYFPEPTLGGGGRAVAWLTAMAERAQATPPLLALDERRADVLAMLGGAHVAVRKGGRVTHAAAQDAPTRGGKYHHTADSVVLYRHEIHQPDVKIHLRDGNTTHYDDDYLILARRWCREHKLFGVINTGITKFAVPWVRNASLAFANEGSPLLLHFEFAKWRDLNHAHETMSEYGKYGPINSVGANLEELRFFFQDESTHPLHLAQRLLLEYELQEVTVHEQEWVATVYRQAQTKNLQQQLNREHQSALMTAAAGASHYAYRTQLGMPPADSLGQAKKLNEEYFRVPLKR